MSVPTVRWLDTRRDWPTAALEALRQGGPVARVLVAQVRGSAPREAGVSMLVGADSVVGTIGGGELEWQAIRTARALLANAGPGAQLQRMVLGTDLGQCCGGVVELWMERLTAGDLGWLERAAQAASGARPVLLASTLGPGGLEHAFIEPDPAEGAVAGLQSLPRLLRQQEGVALLERLDSALPALWLFGAGYVGQAVARLFLELPVRLTWVDARSELFPSPLPGSVRILALDPDAALAQMPAGTHALVMTHNHALDYSLCEALLRRNDFAWLGLIGSRSKAARFRSRLLRAGVPAEHLARLACPIGVPGIHSKWPAAIAVSIAAQLLQQLSATAQSAPAATHAATDCAAADCSGCGTARSA